MFILDIIIALLYYTLIPVAIAFGSFEISKYLSTYLENYIFKRKLSLRTKLILAISLVTLTSIVKSIVEIRVHVISSFLGM
ncbi:hypothetical protein [Staphylococcus phage vB_StaM_PB50]|nr:hypothetical protein [Staphylococcus phage vB_StaM_PB50]